MPFVIQPKFAEVVHDTSPLTHTEIQARKP
jgi:hypothetical protein